MRLAFQNPRITATRGSICARKMPAFASHFLSLFSCCFAPFTPHTNTHSSALWHASRTQPSPVLCFSALASYLVAFLQANGTHVGCAHAFAATKFCIGWVICRVLDMRPQSWMALIHAPGSALWASPTDCSAHALLQQLRCLSTTQDAVDQAHPKQATQRAPANRCPPAERKQVDGPQATRHAVWCRQDRRHAESELLQSQQSFPRRSAP